MKIKSLMLNLGIIVAFVIIGLLIYGLVKTTQKAPKIALPVKAVSLARLPTMEKAEKPAPAAIQKISAPQVAEEEKQKPSAARLITIPEEIEIKVSEGQTTETQFKLINQGAKEASLNIYKIGTNPTDEETEAEVERLLNYKLSISSQEKIKSSSEKTLLYSGVPWLEVFPAYAVLPAGDYGMIKLSAFAADLEAGEYATKLVLLGSSKEELLVLPVKVEVTPAPKIQLAKIEVNDGAAIDTTGNANNIANPGEKVALTVYLDNVGSGDAEDLNLVLSPDMAPVNIIEGNARVLLVPAKSQFQVKFLLEVPQDSHPKIPPNVILTTNDKDGREWTENFYVGDPEKIEYPTGVLVDGKDKGITIPKLQEESGVPLDKQNTPEEGSKNEEHK